MLRIPKRLSRPASAIAALAGAGMLVALVLPTAASAVTSSPTYPQCPAVGHTTGCNVLVTVNADGSTTVAVDTTQHAIDSSDEILVGVVNNDTAPLTRLQLSATAGRAIFGFDSDGICTHTFTGSTYCTNHGGGGESASDPNGLDYQGPDNTFSGISSAKTTGFVNFTKSLAAGGGSTYFSLEKSGFTAPASGLIFALTATVSGAQTYGGSPQFSVAYSAFASGQTSAVVTGTLSCSTSATSSSPVASNYSVSGCSGLSAPGYALSYAYGELAVTQAPLTVTSNSASMTYGGTYPALSASFSGLVALDTPVSESAKTICSSAPSNSSVGSYPIACTTTDPNYLIAYGPEANLQINPAPLTVTSNNASMTYGGTYPALSASFSGLVNGDTVDSESAKTSCSSAPATSSVGNYPITCTTTDGNYSITYANVGVLTINPAPLTVTSNPASMVYGGTYPTFSAAFSGLVNGDTQTSESAKTACSSAPATSGVGNYPITCTTTDANYSITYGIPGELAVTQAPLTVTANNASMAPGASVPALSASFSGLVNGDTASTESSFTTCLTTGSPSSIVGQYPITCTDTDPNYAPITYVAGTLTIATGVVSCGPSGCSNTVGGTNQNAVVTSPSTTGEIFVGIDSSAVSCGDHFRHAPQYTTVTETGLAPGSTVLFTITFANSAAAGNWWVPFAVCYQSFGAPFVDASGHSTLLGLLPMCDSDGDATTDAAENTELGQPPCVQSISEHVRYIGNVVEKVVLPAGDPKFH